MSFVLCVCGMNFSVMMSDGRMISLPNNDIVAENVSKVIKFNKNVAMAYTGDPIPTQIAIKTLEKYNVHNFSMEEIEKIIIEQLKMVDSNILGVKIIFTGKNKDGAFVIHNIDSDNNFTINIVYPRNEGITFSCAGNDSDLCNQVIQDNFSNVIINKSEQLEYLMEKCICDVAKFDKTVNTNIYKVVVK